MAIKIVTITKWILLLSFAQVNSFKTDEFKDGNENLLKELLKNDLFEKEKEVHQFNSNTEAKHSSKNVKNIHDLKDFKFKKLVSRIVPHGYEVKDYDYDNKFKTLFKPLIRIHKKKLEPSEDENPIDIIYLMDNKDFEDSSLHDDDPMLKPFTIDNMEINYLPNYNEEYVLDRSGKDWEDSSPEDQYKKIPNFYLNSNKLQQILGTALGNWVQYDRKPVQPKYMFKVLKNIIENNKKQLRRPKTKPKKLHRFVSVGQLTSKQFLPENNIDENSGRMGPHRIKTLAKNYDINNYPNPNNNNPDHSYTDKKRYINDFKNKQNPFPKFSIPKLSVNKKEIPNSGWFGPIGVMNSKQFTKPQQNDDDLKSKTSKYKELRHKYDNDKILQLALNQILPEKETVISDDKSFKFNDEITENTKFKYLHHDFSEHETNNVPIYLINLNKKQQSLEKSPENEKPTKFTLLNEMAKLKAKHVETDRKKPFKGIELNKLIDEDVTDLRSHFKSGEEEEQMEKHKTKYDYVDENMGTTAKTTTLKPAFPFWNYWTYDKQIQLDDCKGQLLQHGRLCIGAWA